jgi:hypothetical protein
MNFRIIIIGICSILLSAVMIAFERVMDSEIMVYIFLGFAVAFFLCGGFLIIGELVFFKISKKNKPQTW